MKILTLVEKRNQSSFDVFLNSVSYELAAAVCKKLQAYADANEIFISNSLKILKPKIWGYKGTIYKLRVDCGKESARILFANNANNDLVLLHGFVKITQKTPGKEAKIAMENYEKLKKNIDVMPLALKEYS